MKNCLNFKMWLMPLMVVAFLMSNVVQVEAQKVIVMSSDPTTGGQGDELSRSSNTFPLFIQVEPSGLTHK